MFALVFILFSFRSFYDYVWLHISFSITVLTIFLSSYSVCECIQKLLHSLKSRHEYVIFNKYKNYYSHTVTGAMNVLDQSYILHMAMRYDNVSISIKLFNSVLRPQLSEYVSVCVYGVVIDGVNACVCIHCVLFSLFIIEMNSCGWC